MWVDIHGQGLTVGRAERERVERRLRFALGRFGDRLRRVDVYLVDVNGPRGGVDKRCRVVVDVPGHGAVVVEEDDSDLAALIDRSADRVGHAVRRRLDRARLYADLFDPHTAGRN